MVWKKKKQKKNNFFFFFLVCLCWGLTSQSTIFQSNRDGATSSWVINQYFRGVKCLAQRHNTAAVGFEPPTSRSGVRHYFVFSHPGGSVSLAGVRESGSISGRLPDDLGGFTCMQLRWKSALGIHLYGLNINSWNHCHMSYKKMIATTDLVFLQRNTPKVLILF